MSKAILVIDMPKSCDECSFVDEQYHYCNIPWFGKDVSDYVACRHEECPLKSIPNKKEMQIVTNDYDGGYSHGFTNGYNVCVDEILSN